jgi:very-short-patch-repair endonuclease
MHGQVSPTTVDREIATLAARQYGVVTRPQLAALGLGPGAIDHRLGTGRLYRLHRGVYAVGHVAPRREARWLAAVLACGDGALLSHRSAAALWGMRAAEGPHPDVTVPHGRRCALPAIAVHHCRLVAADRASHSRVPVTTPARTLVDLAFVLSADELARTLREAQFLRIFNLAETRDALERRPSRALRALLDDLAVTQSALEDRLLAVCDRYGIPRPLTQQVVVGRRVDFLWAHERVIVETDGWQAHGTATAFQSDRASTNALLLAGYVVLRFTHADVMRRSARVAREIGAALAARDSAR